jgi:hypothetical protein
MKRVPLSDSWSVVIVPDAAGVEGPKYFRRPDAAGPSELRFSLAETKKRGRAAAPLLVPGQVIVVKAQAAIDSSRLGPARRSTSKPPSEPWRASTPGTARHRLVNEASGSRSSNGLSSGLFRGELQAE